jgi:uncharacterized protein YecE (DUF72 family)
MSGAIRVGCSGWQYADWRERFYPKGLPQRRWLEHYAGTFDTVEVNSTFYRLARPAAVAAWIEQTPPGFLFTVKGSRYLTHMKRLLDRDQGLRRFYDSIAPLVASPKLGPVLWQLPPNFRRDDERLDGWLDALTRFGPSRHAVEFRHASWFDPAVYGILHAHGAALVIADDGRRDDLEMPEAVTTEWSFVRLHYGRRGRRGNYAEPELREWAGRVRDLASHGDVFAYFNNDWEGFAVANGVRLKRLLGIDS